MQPLRYIRVVLSATALSLSARAAAQDSSAERASALAVADSALAAISRKDFVAFTDLMLDEAVLFPSSTRNGDFRYALRTRAQQREAKSPSLITERGFRPAVHVQGPIAVVWYPYDLYIDGKWSHCGIDVFTLLKQGGRWRIATMAWSAEQPPVCEPHPAGPPRR